MVERLLGRQEVRGSTPLRSTAWLAEAISRAVPALVVIACPHPVEPPAILRLMAALLALEDEQLAGLVLRPVAE